MKYVTDCKPINLKGWPLAESTLRSFYSFLKVYINYINLCFVKHDSRNQVFKAEKKTPTENKEDATCKFKI